MDEARVALFWSGLWKLVHKMGYRWNGTEWVHPPCAAVGGLARPALTLAAVQAGCSQPPPVVTGDGDGALEARQ